jgi:Na+-transporting methylmalonyl-CoA/oxaloacetate decarboxylase beta subunit
MALKPIALRRILLPAIAGRNIVYNVICQIANIVVLFYQAAVSLEASPQRHFAGIGAGTSKSNREGFQDSQ